MVRAIILALVLVLLVPSGDGAAQTLRGSRGTMERQNDVARQQDYSFLQTPAQVRRFASSGLLVRVPGNGDYALAGVSYPYARPAVKTFLERLGAQYRSACGERLVVTSLTRPVREQPRNASDLSVHPAGMAADLRVSNSSKCRNWLEKTLLQLEARGVVDATRERRPAHYHVAVFPDAYLAYVRRLERDRPPVKLASAPRSPVTPRAVVAADPPAAEQETPPVEVIQLAELEREIDAALAGGPGEPESGVMEVSATDEAAALAEYRVNRGDTLWAIARRHGTTVEQLKELNQLATNRIAAGQVLSVPAAASP